MFYYTGTKISGHHSLNSAIEIIFILSGKYKIFMFVYSVSDGLPLARIDGRGILLTLSRSRD